MGHCIYNHDVTNDAKKRGGIGGTRRNTCEPAHKSSIMRTICAHHTPFTSHFSLPILAASSLKARKCSNAQASLLLCLTRRCRRRAHQAVARESLLVGADTRQGFLSESITVTNTT